MIFQSGRAEVKRVPDNSSSEGAVGSVRRTMTTRRRALVASALGAGISYSNLAVALPLLVLAEHGGPLLAGLLLGSNTLAFSLGALLAVGLRRSEAGVAAGLAVIAIGDFLLIASPIRDVLVVGA